MRTYRAEQAEGPRATDLFVRRDVGENRERAEIIARLWKHGQPKWPAHVVAVEDGEEVGRMEIGGDADGHISGSYP